MKGSFSKVLFPVFVILGTAASADVVASASKADAVHCNMMVEKPIEMLQKTVQKSAGPCVGLATDLTPVAKTAVASASKADAIRAKQPGAFK